jgi:hypothetical protein
MEEVEFVQTFRGSGDTELQFLLRGKPKVRRVESVLQDELEWAARFLRVAIKGRPPEEAAVMKNPDRERAIARSAARRWRAASSSARSAARPTTRSAGATSGQCSTFGCREIRFTRT